MSPVPCREGTWRAPGSARSYAYRIWRPARVLKLVVIAHGFGEHSGRYHRFAEALAGAGLCVAIPDLWGHGRSSGARGDFGELGHRVQDLRLLTEAVFLREAGRERYALLGHSFGGLLAIAWALAAQPRPPTKLVLQSPLLEVGFPIPWWKVFTAKAAACCWPAAPFAMNLNPSNLCHDAAVISAYQQDPLVHNRMSARTYASTLHWRDAAMRRAQEIRMPVLLLCGAEDRIISLDAASRWFDLLRCEKRLEVYPDCLHELHHEAIHDTVSALVGEWLLRPGTA